MSTGTGPVPVPDDPVRARRALMGRLARLGKRVGYSCLGVALVVFLVGALAREVTPLIVTVVGTALVVGSVLLLPAIVVGYGVSAAEREDRTPGDAR